MTVRIDRAVTEVMPAPDASPATSSSDPRWRERESLRRALREREERERRLSAEGFDD